VVTQATTESSTSQIQSRRCRCANWPRNYVRSHVLMAMRNISCNMTPVSWQIRGIVSDEPSASVFKVESEAEHRRIRVDTEGGMMLSTPLPTIPELPPVNILFPVLFTLPLGRATEGPLFPCSCVALPF
jgi:hypothetical protein